jgi:hypothetical protein
VPRDYVRVAQGYEVLSSREYEWDGGSTLGLSCRLRIDELVYNNSVY